MIRLVSVSLISVALLFGAVLSACSGDSVESQGARSGDGVILPDGTVFERGALLDAFATCILSEIEAFEAQSQRFAEAAGVASGDASQENIAEARSSWEASMDIWQTLELMQVGPAGRKTQPGGQGIRESIYPWPHRDYCEIDQNLVLTRYAGSGDEVSPAAKGLWAAEYLLYNFGSSNVCEPTHPINADGTWADVDESEMQVRRARYTQLVAETVARSASTLLSAWSPADGDFYSELTGAGDGSRTYGKKRVALNAVSDAFGYLEWGIKEHKLGRPLGLIGCTEADCARQVESRFSGRSKLNLRNNMVGFRKLFEGCGPDYSGLGFDDYLIAIGASNLAARIKAAQIAVIDALDAIEEPDLVSALEVDRSSVTDLYYKVNSLNGLLRDDFLIFLNLELPQMVQGDND